jgi:hypothetical protein
MFNLALKTLDFLDRISGGHECVGALIWLNGPAECAIVNFADRHNPRRSQFIAIVADLSSRISPLTVEPAYRQIALRVDASPFPAIKRSDALIWHDIRK